MSLTRFKKQLRIDQTDSETRLWNQLRDRNLHDYKFRRQHIIQGYIVDFVCLEQKLIIELDGGQHAERKSYDNKRTQVLEKEGFRVVRFWNNEVLENIEGALDIILTELSLEKEC